MINASTIIPGQMVISKAGRDRGRRFIVMQIVDEQFLLLADGDLRKVGHPKLKKMKHIQKTNRISQSIADRLKKQEEITDTMVRKEIEKLDLAPKLG